MIPVPFYMQYIVFDGGGRIVVKPEQVIDVCTRTGIKRVSIKVVDGTRLYPGVFGNNQKPMKEYIAALRSAGIVVGGWGYHYPDVPGPQGDKIEEVRVELGLDQYELDLEGEWNRRGLGREAETMLGKLHKNKNFGLCSYRYPVYHPYVPYGSILKHEVISYNAPQVYWEQSHDPVTQLLRSYQEYLAYGGKQFVPVGSAYGNGGWEPTAQDIKDFILECKKRGWKYGLYSVDYMIRKNKQDWIEAIAEANGVGDTPPVVPPAVPDDTTYTEFEIISDVLNRRAEPYVGARVLGKLKRGDIVCATSVLGTDAWIQLPDKSWVCVKQGKKRFAEPV